MTRKRSLTLGSQFMDYERVSVYYGTNKQKELSEEQSESAAAETKYAAYQCKNRQAYIAGAVAIHGLRVIDSRKGVFVSMPTRSYTDSNGNTQYSEIAHAVTKETREAINTKVLEAYNQALQQSESNGFTEMDVDDDLPFDEDEGDSMGFAPSM